MENPKTERESIVQYLRSEALRYRAVIEGYGFRGAQRDRVEYKAAQIEECATCIERRLDERPRLTTIIAGSRGAQQDDTLAAIASCPWQISAVVSGTAKGADTFGEVWAAANGVLVRRMPADWSQGRGAGPARNVEMAKVAEALVAVWDGQSRGTRHMINTAVKQGLRVHVYRTGERPGA